MTGHASDHEADDRRYLTDDMVEVTAGLRVFTNDWTWGTVEPGNWDYQGLTDPGGEFFGGWWRVRLDGGSSVLLNADRMTTTRPPGAPGDPNRA